MTRSPRRHWWRYWYFGISAGFHRQARVDRPFAERGVIESDLGVPEHDERECVGAGGNAATAIGDDALVEGANCLEVLAELGRRQEFVGRRIEQMRRGQVDAAFDMTGPSVAVAAGAGVLLGR